MFPGLGPPWEDDDRHPAITASWDQALPTHSGQRQPQRDSPKALAGLSFRPNPALCPPATGLWVATCLRQVMSWERMLLMGGGPERAILEVLCLPSPGGPGCCGRHSPAVWKLRSPLTLWALDIILSCR